jgi:hypothetical protein
VASFLFINESSIDALPKKATVDTPSIRVPERDSERHSEAVEKPRTQETGKNTSKPEKQRDWAEFRGNEADNGLLFYIKENYKTVIRLARFWVPQVWISRQVCLE